MHSPIFCTSTSATLHIDLGSLFGKRGYDWEKMLVLGKLYINNCNKGILEEVLKSNSTLNIMQFDGQRFYLWSMKQNQNEGRPIRHFNVDLHRKWHDCGEFQAFCVLCSHVITSCSIIHQNYSMHILDVYKVLNIFKVYKESFLGVSH